MCCPGDHNHSAPLPLGSREGDQILSDRAGVLGEFECLDRIQGLELGVYVLRNQEAVHACSLLENRLSINSVKKLSFARQQPTWFIAPPDIIRPRAMHGDVGGGEGVVKCVGV